MTSRGADQFGTLLRHYRLAAGLSQEELGERAGLSARGIRALERGERSLPRPHTVRLLASSLELVGSERTAFFRAARPETAADRPAARLPMPPTPFVGRKEEAARLRAMLGRTEVRLVSLIGTGGVGKTRLALQVASEVGGELADGTCFVDLAAIHDPALVASALADELGVRESGAEPLVRRLATALRDRHLLLVIDNFEQVLAGSAVLVALLDPCPSIKILVTTREALRVRVEHIFPVEPLRLPPEQASSADLMGNDAVRLFCERAQTVRPDFALTDSNARVVAAICHQLDGVPLAIELAAARSAIFSPAALLHRLQRRLPVLTGGARDSPVRHQSMREAIAWSYDLLSAEEQTLLRRLAVFSGGFTLEAAEVVGRSPAITEWVWRSRYDDTAPTAPEFEPSPELIEQVTSLLDKSLLRRQEGPTDEPRLSMLDTIREFGLERLEASGEATEIRRRHALAFLSQAERIGPQVEGSTPREAMALLSADDANLRTALEWAVADGETEIALRLVVALHDYNDMRSRFRQSADWAERALALRGEAGTDLRIEAMFWAAIAHHHAGNYDRVGELAEALLALAEDGHNVTVEAMRRLLLSFVAGSRNDGDTAVSHAEEALCRFRTLPSQRWLATAVRRLGIVRLGRGQYDSAEALFEESLQIFRQIDDAPGIAMALYNLASTARGQGDLARAASLICEALMREEALDRRWMIAQNITGLADVALARDHTTHAVRLMSAASALAEAIGFSPYSWMRETRDRVVATAHQTLGDKAVAAAWQEGRALPPQAAIAEALAFAQPGTERGSMEPAKSSG